MQIGESFAVQAALDFPRELSDTISGNCRVFVCLVGWFSLVFVVVLLVKLNGLICLALFVKLLDSLKLGVLGRRLVSKMLAACVGSSGPTWLKRET